MCGNLNCLTVFAAVCMTHTHFSLAEKWLWAPGAGPACVYKVEQRHNAGSYASDYLPTWAGLAASPEAAFAGICEMHRAGSSSHVHDNHSPGRCIIVQQCST